MRVKALVCLLPLIMLFGCAKTKLESQWRDREITIDGSATDWEGKMTYLEQQNLSWGLMNDQDFIYLCFVVDGRQSQRQLIGRGLVLWFDPQGGKHKRFGIHFPIGMTGMDMRETGAPPEGGRGEGEISRREPGRRETGDRSMQGPVKIPEAALQELEILGPEKDYRNRIKVSALQGIEIKLSDQNGALVYELKVPLTPSKEHHYAIGTQAGRKIGIGLETPDINRDQLVERMAGFGGGEGGGMRGGGGGFGGRGGGFGRSGGFGGRGQEMAEPLKVWAEVELASQ
jgi:hypothetical protein